MLSKFIYKVLLVAVLGVFSQVAYGQDYVSTDVAIDRLEQAIADLQPNVTSTPGQFGAQPNQVQSMDLKVMSKTKQVLSQGNLSVDKVIMAAEVEATKANDALEARYVAAINKVKNLLSN